MCIRDRLTGQLLSMAIAMLIFSLYGLDRAQITPASYPVLLATVRMAFLIFAGLCLAGVFASLARGKLGRKAWRAVEG